MPASRWSVPPLEPPPIAVPAGSAFHASSRLRRFWCGDAAGTTMTSKSSASRAIGVTSARVVALSLAMMPPTITVPVTINVLPCPDMSVSWPSPMVPAAPGMLTTWTLLTMPSALRACWDSRATRSQPPPGAAGAIRPSRLRAESPASEPSVLMNPATMTTVANTAHAMVPTDRRRGGSAGGACSVSAAIVASWSVGKAHGQHRHRGVEQDVLRGRAEQQLADRGPSPQPDDDQLGVELAGQVEQLVGQVVRLHRVAQVHRHGWVLGDGHRTVSGAVGGGRAAQVGHRDLGQPGHRVAVGTRRRGQHDEVGVAQSGFGHCVPERPAALRSLLVGDDDGHLTPSDSDPTAPPDRWCASCEG